MSKYGCCHNCGADLEPVWFTEEETKVVGGTMIRTGRKRRAVSHLECSECLKKEPVDDSFDGPWH